MMSLFKMSKADVIHMEFASKGYDELAAFKAFPKAKVLGVGVIDAKNTQVELPEQIAERIRKGRKWFRRIGFWSRHCGLGYFSRTVAYAKLRAMGEATKQLRKKL